MKTFVLSCLVALGALGALALPAIAAPATPYEAVKAMIEATHEREIASVDLDKVDMKPEEIVKLFNDVDLDKAVFVSWDKAGKLWHQQEGHENYLLRMANPMCIGFEVRFVPDPKDAAKGHYEVVKIQL